MSKFHHVCFKHLKRNCKCTSSKSIDLHHSTRIPPDGKKGAWKEFVDWLLSNGRGSKEMIRKSLEGTRFENRIEK